MYRRIVLAYDGSLGGLIALREGALLASRFGAKVHLLSVVRKTEGPADPESFWDAEVAQKVHPYRRILIRGVSVLQGLGVHPYSRLLFGDPAPRIGEYAREVQADLVVLGQHHRTPFERWWSGGKGTYVADHVHCSLLIAKTAVTDEAFRAGMSTAVQGAEPTSAT